eukprot:2569235-Rhodomonas_salina.2
MSAISAALVFDTLSCLLQQMASHREKERAKVVWCLCWFCHRKCSCRDRYVRLKSRWSQGQCSAARFGDVSSNSAAFHPTWCPRSGPRAPSRLFGGSGRTGRSPLDPAPTPPADAGRRSDKVRIGRRT